MNEFEDHAPQAWIGAYHDGELSGQRLRQVEAHLATCAECRARLEAQHSLSNLLQTDVPARGNQTADRFVSQVMLRLPPAPQTPPQPSFWRAVWKLTPVVLLSMWAFTQAILVAAMLGLAVIDRTVPGWLSGWDAVTVLPGLSAGYLLPALQLLLFEVAFTLLVTGLLWGWLASWWAVNRQLK
jgi:anti-sigma factor RsiW